MSLLNLNQKDKEYLAIVAAGLAAAGLMKKAIGSVQTTLPITLSIQDMDAIYDDRQMVRALKIIEPWSKLNPIYYEQIVIYLDKMLTIERAILNKESMPSLKNLDCAYQYFRLAVRYLTDYRETILRYCGTDDITAFDSFCHIIYTRAQDHFLTIVNRCRRFDTKQYLAATQERIDQIVAAR
jgi:hypothetical protein